MMQTLWVSACRYHRRARSARHAACRYMVAVSSRVGNPELHPPSNRMRPRPMQCIMHNGRRKDDRAPGSTSRLAPQRAKSTNSAGYSRRPGAGVFRRPASQLDLFQVFCPQDTTVRWKPVRRLIPRNFQFISLFLCVQCLQFISYAANRSLSLLACLGCGWLPLLLHLIPMPAVPRGIGAALIAGEKIRFPV